MFAAGGPHVTKPAAELSTREYRGYKYVAQDLADADAKRLAGDGWRVLSSEWLEPDEAIGCIGVMMTPWRTTPFAPSRREFTLRVTYRRPSK